MIVVELCRRAEASVDHDHQGRRGGLSGLLDLGIIAVGFRGSRRVHTLPPCSN
jgi:hypothetical protein